MPGTEKVDKRASKRFPVSLFINQEYGDRRQSLGMSLDLSATGVTVISTLTDGPPPEGRHAWLRFKLPGRSGTISALGEVVHRERDREAALERTGMHFKFLFPDQRRMLEEYLAEVASRGSRPSAP